MGGAASLYPSADKGRAWNRETLRVAVQGFGNGALVAITAVMRKRSNNLAITHKSSAT